MRLNDEDFGAVFKQSLQTVAQEDAKHRENVKKTMDETAKTVRAYSGLRQYSHFEKGSDGVKDTSWWQFPTDMKYLTKEKIQNHLSVFAHKSSSIRPCAIGEDTDIHAFYEHNQHLPADWSYLDKGVLPYRDYQELYSDVLHSMSDSFVKNPEEPGVEYE